MGAFGELNLSALIAESLSDTNVPKVAKVVVANRRGDYNEPF